MGLGMVKGYWVALAETSAPEGYKAYIAENAKAFRKYGGRFLTRGGASERPEGITRSRIVVIEFPVYGTWLFRLLWRSRPASRRVCLNAPRIEIGGVAIAVFLTT